MPTLGEWDSWLERSKAKFAPYEVPEEEREQALSEGNVGQYPGDDPEKFLKSGRKEFSQLRADRLALVDQVNKARSKEKELHPYPKLERAFSAVTGSVPSFLSPDVPAPDIPAQPTPDRVVTPVRPPKPEAPQAQREPAIIGSSAQQALPSNSPPLGTRQDDRFGLRQVAPLDVRGMQRTIREKSADLTRRRAELDDLQGQLDKVNPQFQIRTGQYPALTDEEREQYDVTRNVFNQKAQEFNAQRDEYNRLTRQFNKKIDAHARQQVTPQIRPAIDRFGSSMDFGTPDTVVQNQPVATPKPRSFGEALTLATNNLFQGAAGIPADILKSIAIASKDVDAWLPEALKDKRPVEDRLTYKMGQAVERVAKRAFPSDPESRKEFMIGVLPQAVGSMAAFMTGGLAGAATKSPALVGGAISSLMGAGAQGTQQYEEAKSFGADEPTQRKAFWLGSAVGSSESLPIAGLLNRFNKATGGGFFKVLKESGVTAAQEFIQEWGQQVGSNAIAKELYDENRGLLEGAGISGAAGGVTGAVAGLLSGVLAGRKIRKQQQAHEGSKTTESPFAEEPTLRTTPLRMPQPTQPSMQQTVPLSPSPHDLIASIPSDLTVSQRPPFLIRKGPMASAVSAVPTPSPMPPATPEAIPLAPNPIEPIETPAAQAMSAMPAATPDSVGREPNIVQQQTIPIRTIPLEPEPREPRIVQEPTVQTRPVSITPDSLQGSASPSTQGPSVEDIHDLADRKGIAWDNNRQFMDLTEDVTGKRHLDDLTGPERTEMVQAIEAQPSQWPYIPSPEDVQAKPQPKLAKPASSDSRGSIDPAAALSLVDRMYRVMLDDTIVSHHMKREQKNDWQIVKRIDKIMRDGLKEGLGYEQVAQRLDPNDLAALRAMLDKPSTSPVAREPIGTPDTVMDRQARQAEPGPTTNTAPIDEQSHEAATSPTNALAEPSEAQREAGNYKLGHAKIAGLDISIEYPEGSVRSGVSKTGKPWQQELRSHYGYIRSFSHDGERVSPKGKDNEHIDLFIRPGTPPTYDGPVYIVDQVDPETGRFDEVKVMLGYPTKASARQGYLENYKEGWNGLGNITLSHLGEFKQWLASKQSGKPFSGEPSKQWAKPEVPPPPDVVAKNEPVQAATTPDTVVSNPLVQQPRSELPIEQNMEMQLRSEKAQADMEIAGQERGGRTFIEQHGHGSTPETIGFKSATADWYKELTNGPRPLKRAQIETAIQKIIKDHGVDVGVAVERVKEALLGDHEFNKTPWGKDAESIRQGEWPSWIEKPTGQAVPTPDEALTKAVPQQGGPVSPSVPTPDLALTAPFVKPDESPNKKAKVEPTDLSTASYSDLVRMMENGVESRRRLRDLPPVQKQEAMGFVESGMKPTASNIKQWLESQGTIGYVETTVKQIQKNYKDAFAAKREGDANRELSEREKSGDLSPRKQKQTETPPTPDLVLTATQSRPTNERSQPTPKSEQMSIYVPPETIGSRPIIGREAQPEEAPLFSKAAQEKEAEQTALEEQTAEYPDVQGRLVDGLYVLGDTPNQDSIAATLDDYKILKGIKEVPLSDFESAPNDLFYAADDIRRTKALAEQIKQSGEVKPLIVVTKKGEKPYILEGAHRLGALHILGKKAFPAMVVEDLSTEQEPAPPVTPKEPWQMTALEYAKSHLPPDVAARITKPQRSFEAQHRKEITEAMRRGETIPPEVLAYYPDLQPKPKVETLTGRAKDDFDDYKPVLERQVSAVTGPNNKALAVVSVLTGLHPQAQKALADHLKTFDPTAYEALQERNKKYPERAIAPEVAPTRAEIPTPEQVSTKPAPVPTPEMVQGKAFNTPEEQLRSVVKDLADMKGTERMRMKLSKLIDRAKGSAVDLPKAKENTKVDNVSQPKQVKANKPIDELSAPDRLANRAKGIPRAADPPIASYQNNDQVKAHKDYRAAKSGDSEAAFRLVRDMVKPETAQEVQKRFPGSIFIAPLSQEASGLNAIPKTLAAHYADLAGGMADSRIKQVNKTFHTGADPMERILARPIFEGPVTPGGKYVLVDDVITMGGTLAELANHIRQGGGEVVGIAALTNASRSGRLTPSKHHVRLIEERFGDALREEFGIEPAALTGPESGYLVNFRDADELRTRSARAKEQRTRRLSAKEVSRPQDHPVADTPSPKSEQNITELSAPDRSEPAKKAESSSSAKEIADLFKQESEHAKNAVRPTQPRIPIAPITGGPSTPIGEIILNLEKGTGKKLTIGKTRSGTAGVYKPGSSATIIKYSGDLDKTAHELAGHFLDDKYGLMKEWKGQDTSPFDAELEPFSQHGSSGPNSSPTYNRAEGVAEYIRAWLVNPAAAEAAAPQFTAHVKAKLPTEVQKAHKTFSTQMRQWYGNTAHAKIMANVQWETPETGLTQWLAGSRTAKGPGFQLTFGDQMATAWTDRLAPFMKALQYAREQRGIDREPLLPGNDPALLSRLFMGINAKLDDIFAHGMVDSQLERATPGGLSWLMEPLDQTSSKALEADMQEVASLMIAQRTVEKAEQLGKQRVSGIGAGIDSDMAVAEARLAELKKDEARYAKLKEAASRYRQWADANLRYLVDKGRFSQEQYENIKANNEQYVAMQRILEVSPGEELAVFMPRGAPSRKLGAVGTPVHGFKGSTRTIKNPYLSLMDATHRSIMEADRNEIMKLFRDLLTVDRGLYDGEPNNLATVGREAQAGEKQTIPIFVNGKKEVWQFHPDVYKALKGIEDGTYKLPPFLTILPRILRATIVNTPAFALRNVIRDAWQRSIASLSGSKPWDTLKVYSKEEISQLKRSGGDQAGHYYTDSKNYARAMKFAMQEAVASHNSIVVDPAKLWTWAKQGGHSYLDLMQGSERQGRLSEYRRAFRKAKKQFGYDDYHAMLYAASQSRGLIDYAIAGNTMSLINQLIPFSNAAVQGLRSNLLRAKADPAGFALRFGVFALVPALMNYAWNYLYDGDDLDEYRQLPAYQRDLFWNFKLGPDLWLKVPKPFELGVMASSFERMLDYSTGNTKAFDGHVGAFLRTLLPVDDASLAGPYQSWLQAATNYDFFRDRPIVPRWEENLALDLRNYHRASRLGQALQQVVGVDARKIDFLLQSQFGYVGRYAVDLSDTGRKDKHGLTLSASGVTGGSPASVSIDAKEVSKIAEERGVVPSRSKAVDRVTNMSQITTRNAKHPDSLRYAVFRKHLNEYYKAESREDRDRLAKQVRTDAQYLRDLWEKQPPRPEADDKIKKKRALESEYDPFLDLMGFPQPLSKHPTSTLHELVP